MAANIVESEEESQETSGEPFEPEEEPGPIRELLSDALRKDASDPVFGKEFKPSLFLEFRTKAEVSSLLEQDYVPARSPGNKLDMILLSPESDSESMHHLLPYIYYLLAPRGRIYLVLSADDKPVELCRYMSKKGLASREVISKQCGHGETLSVFCFTRQS